jgi:hypothetical protein
MACCKVPLLGRDGELSIGLWCLKSGSGVLEYAEELQDIIMHPEKSSRCATHGPGVH